MLTPCWPHIDPMLTPCWPHIDPTLTPCWPHVDPMLTPCWPHIDPMLTPCWPHIDPMLTPCWPHVDPMLTPYWPHVSKWHFINLYYSPNNNIWVKKHIYTIQSGTLIITSGNQGDRLIFKGAYYGVRWVIFRVLQVTTDYVVPGVNAPPPPPPCGFFFILCMVNRYWSNELRIYCIYSCFYGEKIIPLIRKIDSAWVVVVPGQKCVNKKKKKKKDVPYDFSNFIPILIYVNFTVGPIPWDLRSFQIIVCG